MKGDAVNIAATQHGCQTPGCSYDASSKVKRGMAMDWLCLCAQHARRFHEMSDQACAAASACRTALRTWQVEVGAWTVRAVPHDYTSRD